jgi:hypothetical protein
MTFSDLRRQAGIKTEADEAMEAYLRQEQAAAECEAEARRWGEEAQTERQLAEQMRAFAINKMAEQLEEDVQAKRRARREAADNDAPPAGWSEDQ